MDKLGCDFAKGQIIIRHQSRNICCMLDQVHMVKVLRNVWARLGEIHWPCGIDIENLVKL